MTQLHTPSTIGSIFLLRASADFIRAKSCFVLLDRLGGGGEDSTSSETREAKVRLSCRSFNSAFVKNMKSVMSYERKWGKKVVHHYFSP